LKQILVRTELCLGCKSCEIACATAHSTSKNLIAALFERQKPQKRVFVETNGQLNLPLQCRQCADTPCVHACMSGAMFIDEVTGLALLDESKCVGCWMCVMTCPFGVITQNKERQLAIKCDRCQELSFDPACVKACPTKALVFEEVGGFSKTVRQSYFERFVEKSC